MYYIPFSNNQTKPKPKGGKAFQDNKQYGFQFINYNYNEKSRLNETIYNFLSIFTYMIVEHRLIIQNITQKFNLTWSLRTLILHILIKPQKTTRLTKADYQKQLIYIHSYIYRESNR